jgi:hypothetical protein
MTINSTKLGPGRLTLGPTGTTKEFGGQLRSCKLEPSVDTTDPIPVLSGEELPGDDTYSYVLSGTILDDYNLATSLAVWAETNKGDVLPFEFVPANAGTLQVSGSVKVQPIGIGGDVKTRNENDFEFALVGDPVYESNA